MDGYKGEYKDEVGDSLSSSDEWMTKNDLPWQMETRRLGVSW